MKKIIRVQLDELEIHPLVMEIKHFHPVQFMTFTMKHFSQKTAVIVVERKGNYLWVLSGNQLLGESKREGHSCTTQAVDDGNIL